MFVTPTLQVLSKRKKEKERCSTLVDKLVDEDKRQQEHMNRVHARLDSEKESWFPASKAKILTLTTIYK